MNLKLIVFKNLLDQGGLHDTFITIQAGEHKVFQVALVSQGVAYWTQQHTSNSLNAAVQVAEKLAADLQGGYLGYGIYEDDAPFP